MVTRTKLAVTDEDFSSLSDENSEESQQSRTPSLAKEDSMIDAANSLNNRIQEPPTRPAIDFMLFDMCMVTFNRSKNTIQPIVFETCLTEFTKVIDTYLENIRHYSQESRTLNKQRLEERLATLKQLCEPFPESYKNTYCSSINILQRRLNGSEILWKLQTLHQLIQIAPQQATQGDYLKSVHQQYVFLQPQIKELYKRQDEVSQRILEAERDYLDQYESMVIQSLKANIINKVEALKTDENLNFLQIKSFQSECLEYLASITKTNKKDAYKAFLDEQISSIHRVFIVKLDKNLREKTELQFLPKEAAINLYTQAFMSVHAVSVQNPNIIPAILMPVMCLLSNGYRMTGERKFIEQLQQLSEKYSANLKPGEQKSIERLLQAESPSKKRKRPVAKSIAQHPPSSLALFSANKRARVASSLTLQLEQSLTRLRSQLAAETRLPVGDSRYREYYGCMLYLIGISIGHISRNSEDAYLRVIPLRADMYIAASQFLPKESQLHEGIDAFFSKYKLEREERSNKLNERFEEDWQFSTVFNYAIQRLNLAIDSSLQSITYYQFAAHIKLLAKEHQYVHPAFKTEWFADFDDLLDKWNSPELTSESALSIASS